MKLREKLLLPQSRASCDSIVAWVNGDQERFDALFTLFTCNEYRLVQHAARPLSLAATLHPALLKKQFKILIGMLDKPGVHAAVKRNTLRLLQEIDVPKKYHGVLMSACFRYISIPGEAIAVKAFALSVLERLSKQYPVIIPEVKLLIEENYDRETPAFRSRAKRFLRSST